MKRTVALLLGIIFLMAGISVALAASEQLSDQDKKFLQDSAERSMFELQAAKMAQQKAADQQVKNYARKVQRDHSNIQQQVQKLAREGNVQLPQKLSDAYQTRINQLSKLSGQDFEKEYLKTEVQTHKDDMWRYQKEASDTKNGDMLQFTKKTAQVLSENLQRAQNLSGSAPTAGGRGASGSAG